MPQPFNRLYDPDRMPDPIRGEVVAAFIVPAPGHAPSPALAAEIQLFVKERLSAHEYPRKVHFIEEMPTTITGKIRRVDLRKLALAARPTWRG